jgi:hypothetical protein
LLPVLTFLVAALWAWGAWAAVKHTGSVNTTRALLMLMTPSTMPASNPYFQARPSHNIFSVLAGAATVTSEQRAAQEKLQQQIGMTEGILLVWKWCMWALAGIFTLLTLTGLTMGRSRGCQIAVGVLMLAGVALTLLGMRLMQLPDWGGMPPLSPLSYVLVALVQGAYAVVLFVVFGPSVAKR